MNRIIPPMTWVVVTPPKFYEESQKFAKEQPRFYFTTGSVLLSSLLKAQKSEFSHRVVTFPNLSESLASGLRGNALDISTDGEVSFDGVST